ncbi:MAG: tetratricopeptide repeat protein [Gemmatimonadales bacterium]
MKAPALDTWRRLEPILDAALDLAPEARERFLDRACGQDAQLRSAAGRWLRAAEETSELLRDSAADYAEPLLSSPALAAGTKIGAYRVGKELGRGGMGAVYLAERDDPDLPLKVALKVLPPGLDSDPELTRRLTAERRILAGLEHPHIARLLDGGLLPSGSPWFAMELVGGEPLLAYCDARRLTVEERLRFFLQICEAVQHAHQNLVVHRDLKPSNVLVTRQGVVKLLDFGIAKLLGPDQPSGAEVTRTLQRPLTPEYASPEQIRGEPPSTAADVYSLGVVLYELLTGQRPLRLAHLPPHEWGRAVLDLPPRPPSAVVEPGSEAAPARGVSPERLRRRLRGDLDLIALTALRKEPERRYSSVERLAEDVRRHLDRLPIAARRDSWWYRAGKVVSRHPVVVGLAATLLLTLTAFVLTTLAQSGALRERTAQAEQVVEFLTGLFEASDPDASGGATVTARQLLERGSRSLEQSLADNPTLRAEMLRTVGVLHHRLGDYPEARRLLERASVVLDSVGARPLDRAGVEAGIASVLLDQGEFAAAESVARRVLTSRRRALDAGDRRVTDAMTNLAAILERTSQADEADSLYARALAIERRRGDQSAVAGTLGNLGVFRLARGDPAEATKLLEEAVAIDRALHGEEHTRTATDLQNLAAALSQAAAFDSAERLLERVVEIRERLLGPDHPLVANALALLAGAVGGRGRLDSAATLERRVLELRRAALGEAHPKVAEAWNSLAVGAYRRSRYQEAAAHIERAVAIWRGTLGESHPTFLTGFNNLGAIRRAAGDLAGAEPVLREALALRRRVLGDDHQDVAQTLNNLGQLLDAAGRPTEALDALVEAERIYRARLGSSHVRVADVLVNRGKLLCETGREVAGEEATREAVALRRAALDPASVALAEAEGEWAICLAARGRQAQAESLLATAIPRVEAQLGTDATGSRRLRDALRKVRTHRD